MSIKRYNVMSYSIDAEGFTGPFVKHEDHLSEVAKLQSQLTALTSQLERVVAENATQRHLLDMIGETGNANLGRTLFPIPATDAFLAEVRASGVEMFAEHLSGMNISASETSVREFAAQLRQGGAE